MVTCNSAVDILCFINSGQTEASTRIADRPQEKNTFSNDIRKSNMQI